MPLEGGESLGGSGGNARRANTAQVERVEHTPEQAQQAREIGIELEHVKSNRLKAKFLRLIERIKERRSAEYRAKKEKDAKVKDLEEDIVEFAYDPLDGLEEGNDTLYRMHARQSILKEARKLGDDVEKRVLKALAEHERRLQQAAHGVSAEEISKSNGHAKLNQADTETTLHQTRIPDAERLNRFNDVFANVAFTDPNLESLRLSFGDMIGQEAAGQQVQNYRRVTATDAQRALELIENRLNQAAALNPADVTAARGVAGRLRNLVTDLLHGQEELRMQHGHEAITGVTNEEGLPLKLIDIVWNRRMRNKVFDNIYKNPDSKPHEFWDRAFNILTDGRIEEDFFSFLKETFRSTQQELEQKYPGIIDLYYEHRQEDIARNIFGVLSPQPPTQTNQLTPDNRKVIFEELKTELQKDHDLYMSERQARETLHNASSILYRPDVQAEQLFNFIKQFRGDIADLAHRFHGIRQMMEIYEDQVRLAALAHDGYIRHEDLAGKTMSESRVIQGNKVEVLHRLKEAVVEERSKKIFHDRYKRGMIYMRTDDGRLVDMRAAIGAAALEDWELQRIMTISRGMMIASQRLISQSAESRLTKPGQINQLFLQNILYVYSPFVHLHAKYLYPGPKTSSSLIFDPNVEYWGPGDIWIKPHHVAAMKHDADFYKKHPIDFLESHDLAQLNMQNPNRAGDLYTWLSGWRVSQETSSNETITRDFMRRGQRLMLETILEQNPGASADYAQLRLAASFQNPSTEEFYTAHNNVNYTNFADESQPPTEYDFAVVNLYTYLNGGSGVTPDNRAQMRELNGRLNEYAKWIGTGLRFEGMRKTLDYLYSRDATKRRTAEALVQNDGPAMQLLGHIVDFQPDKIFLKSRKIQRRVMPHLREIWRNRIYTRPDGTAVNATVDGIYSEDRFQEVMQSTMSDLQFMQDLIYQNRERIIKAGGSFDDITFLDRQGNIQFDLNLILETVGGVDRIPMPDPTHANGFDYLPEPPQGTPERARYDELLAERRAMRQHIQQQLTDGTVKEFIQAMQYDWDTNQGSYKASPKSGLLHEGNPTYFEEFIRYRDYYHGFVLWSGDAPVEEFHHKNLGDTGAFTMRAGNSIDSMKASQAFGELIKNMSSIQTAAEAVQLLGQIYTNIKEYDIDLAQQVIGEWAERLLKLYGADWKAWAPIIGGINKYLGKDSFIQTWYGKRMPSWEAVEKRHLLDLIKEKGYITPEKFKELLPLARARWWFEVPLDKVNYPLQLLLIAGFIYTIQKGLSDDER
ncbi:MAG: hypothetical protein HY428_01240 [Candidatus Levybacteria bacterium]|nr:hypothetical protein [Candidatus Levybacteria bacterium]